MSLEAQTRQVSHGAGTMTKPWEVADGDGGQGQICLLSAGPVGKPTSGSDGNAMALADHQSGRSSSLQLPRDRRGSSDSHHAMPTGQAGRGVNLPNLERTAGWQSVPCSRGLVVGSSLRRVRSQVADAQAALSNGR